MNSSTADALTDTLFQAAADGRLFDGQLLAPAAADQAHGAYAGSYWRFASSVPDETLTAFRESQNACVATSDVLGLTDTRAYWVVAYQVGTIQHRFVLPLAGTEVAEMARTLSPAALVLEMTAASGREVLSVCIPVSQQVRASVSSRCVRSFKVEDFLQEMLVISARLLTPSSLRPAPGEALPARVSVTGVLPASLFAQM